MAFRRLPRLALKQLFDVGLMSSEVIYAAMAAWAAKDLPARLHAAQVAKLLNCSADDVAILASAGKIRPLGKPRPSAVKYFSTVELITLLSDREWLDEVTKTISAYWRRKNERRKGAVGTNPVRKVSLTSHEYPVDEDVGGAFIAQK